MSQTPTENFEFLLGCRGCAGEMLMMVRYDGVSAARRELIRCTIQPFDDKPLNYQNYLKGKAAMAAHLAKGLDTDPKATLKDASERMLKNDDKHPHALWVQQNLQAVR